MNEVPVITLDGPSGSGKGTICARLAEQLNWHILDSGALYRIVAWVALAHEMDLSREVALAELIAQLEIRFSVKHSWKVSKSEMGRKRWVKNMIAFFQDFHGIFFEGSSRFFLEKLKHLSITCEILTYDEIQEIVENMIS